MSIPIIVLLVFALVLMWLGSRHGSTTHTDDYHMGAKKVGLFHVVFGIFSVVGAGEFIYVTTLSYNFGLWSAFLFFGFAIGSALFLLFTRVLRKHNEMGYKDRKYDVFSIPDHLYITYNNNRKISIIATALVLLSLFALLLIQYELGGYMIQIITGLPYAWCVILMAATVFVYVYSGGFRGVLITDIVQVCMMFVLFVTLAIFFEAPANNSALILEKTHFFDTGTFFYLLLGGICWVLGGGDIWQRVLSAKSDVVARKSLWWNIFLLSGFGLIIAFLGTKIAIALPDADPNNAFVTMLLQLPQISVILSSIAALGLFAGLISTADTELFTVSTLLHKEYTRNSPHTLENGLSVKNTRLIVVVISILAVLITLFKNVSLVNIYFILLNLFMILGAVTFASFLGRGRPRYVLTGLIIGSALLVYIYLKDLPSINAGYNILVFIPPLVLSLLHRNPSWKRLEKT